MDHLIPAWLTTPALLAGIAALVGAVVPIVAKVFLSWVSHKDSSNLIIRLDNGNKVSIKAGALDEATVLRVLDAVKGAKSTDKVEPHD